MMVERDDGIGVVFVFVMVVEELAQVMLVVIVVVDYYFEY